MVDDPPWWRAPSVIFALGALVVVVVADVVLRSLGGTPSHFSLFIGRLHPLAVHLPIGIVLLVGAAEAATLSPRLRTRLDPAIALALPILVLTTVGAFVFGHLLARAGDFSPKALLAHRRAEFFAAVGICLCPVVWAYQERARTAAARLAYRGVLGLTLAVLSLGAHFGGTLTRGESYLGRYAPGPLRGLLGGGEAKPASTASARPPGSEPRLYADVIQPILDHRCGSCHGPEKSKGGLRLDSLAAIQKGGEEDGPALVAFEPERSPLLARVLLPKAHEDHMPPEDKPQPTPAELAALGFWIERGGGDTLLVRDLLAPAEARSVLEQALTKTPKGAGSAEPPSTPASSPPPDAAASAKTPTAVAPSGAATASPPGSAPSDPTLREPRAVPKPGDEQASTAAPHEGTPSAGASSAGGILAERCAKCHGASKQKSKLRVDSLDALLRGGKSGPALVPGEPRASALLQAIQKPLDDEQHMPPKKEPQLTPREIAVLTAWIRSLKPTSAAAPAPSLPDTAPAPPSAPSPPDPALAPDTAPTPPSAPSPPAPAAATASAPPSSELLAALPARLALYPSQIAPLLREHCDLCHSGSAPSGGLSVESHAALLRGGDTGPAVIPGKPEASELVRRISLPPGDSDRMPPEGSTELTADDIALVTAWVARDAGESSELELQTLPAAAVRAIAAHPPPTRSRDTMASASPRARGGCGACIVSGRDAEPSFPGYAAGALMLGLTVRRVRRRAAA